MNKKPTTRRPKLMLDVGKPQALIMPVSGVSYEIIVQRKSGEDRYTAMDLEWKSDRRISFLDLGTKRQTTISSDYIKVVEIPAK